MPLILTHVQRGFYFTPSLPFYAIGFSLIVAPGLQELINRIDIERKSFKVFKTMSFVLFFIIIFVSGLQIGKKGRDYNTLHDVYLIGDIIPESSIINIDESIYVHWGLQFYLMRYFKISVDPSTKQHEYYLVEKERSAAPLGKYKKVLLMTKQYDLYKIDQ